MDFNYEKPDSKQYLKGVIVLLNHKGEKEIANLLNGSRCEISFSDQFSHKRWDAFYTTVHFYVPIEKFEAFTDVIRPKILDTCDSVMPKSAGYDVMAVEFSPLLDSLPVEPSLSDDLKRISSGQTLNLAKILPEDIVNKGEEMAEVYLYLYCMENSLRLFIENTTQKMYGTDWFKKLHISKSIRNNIKLRKEAERRHQWMSVRETSDLFLIDFKDLGAIISLNWDIFEAYFPDQTWINSKIDELVQCRNRIAHNSYIDESEKDLLKVYYHNILKQIGIIQ